MDVSVITILFTFLVLAGVIGYFVVWGVTPALHTPLMAVTNAISGIVVVAAILVAGPALLSPQICFALFCPDPTATTALQLAAKSVGFVAVVLCAINMFGGFAITKRMLAMYRSEKKPASKTTSQK